MAWELRSLEPKYRNKADFERVINCTQLPFMVLLYRSDAYGLGKDDAKRMDLLFEAIDAGAGMVDVMGDLYDPSPDECTHDPAAIRKQKRTIEKVHKMGAQVIMSSHPCRAMTSDEVFNQLRSFADRGADVVKLVATVNTDDEFTESVRTLLRLHRELKTPFVYLCGGKFATIQRFLGTKLGGAITFAEHEYHARYGFAPPLIKAFKTVQETIRWHI